VFGLGDHVVEREVSDSLRETAEESESSAGRDCVIASMRTPHLLLARIAPACGVVLEVPDKGASARIGTGRV
jgi:hypothetical protein